MGDVYTMPSSLPFARSLARGILNHTDSDPQKLGNIRLLLPTRRACRIVQNAFLRESEGKALLLPFLQPLGEADDEEMMLGASQDSLAVGFADLPPAIPEIKRRILMAQMIKDHENYSDISSTQALKLAMELCGLIDQFHTEQVDFDALDDLVMGEISAHWQITLNFLNMFKTTWPKILDDLGMIEAADRRNRLLGVWAQNWRDTYPKEQIIAAGMTGSIPAAAELLEVIHNIQDTHIILPGLDHHLEDDAWLDIEENHPQAGLKDLINTLGVPREQIATWPYLSNEKTKYAREVLSSETMRPASSTVKWQSLTSHDTGIGKDSVENITRINAVTPQEEAMSIALIMRETLNTENKTANLITADRNLARRVAESLRRWDINVDDSAGIPMLRTPRGNFVMQVLNTAKHNAAPIALLSLLKHQFFGDQWSDQLRNEVRKLDIKKLRGIFTPQILSNASEGSELLTQTLHHLNPLMGSGYATLKEWLTLHLKTAEILATTKDKDGAKRLWSGEDGEALSTFFGDIMLHATSAQKYTLSEYIDLIDILASGVNVRPKYGTHPRLSILGVMESRMSDADVMILGGLNEGTWPPAATPDPWLSRQMRLELKLPTPETKIGYTAHDFVQHFCKENIVLTRCQKEDGALTTPARWLTRLDTVLHALGLQDAISTSPKYLDWAQQMDNWDEDVTPIDHPKPAPPFTARPTELPVTAFEHWMGDPYAIYAKYILNLRKPKDLEEEGDASIRGTIVHEVLHEYIKRNMISWPEDAAKEMIFLAEEIAHKHGFETPKSLGWWPRIVALLKGFAETESTWRQEGHKPIKLEHEGAFEINDFTITAKADRLEKLSNGELGVIDYKTSDVKNAGDTKTGYLPQLPLEAVLVKEGGFKGVSANDVGYMAFWELVGDTKTNINYRSITPNKDETFDDLISQTKEGVNGLIEIFKNKDTPYISLPNPDKMPTYRDYDHLARFKEWADEDGEDAA